MTWQGGWGAIRNSLERVIPAKAYRNAADLCAMHNFLDLGVKAASNSQNGHPG
jgi:hypothetical protein